MDLAIVGCYDIFVRCAGYNKLFLCFLQAMADAACPAYILETRKTAPGLRLVDKWAVKTSPCSLTSFKIFFSWILFG